jgi:hypothetical protein
VNTLGHTDQAKPRSVLFPTFDSDTTASQSFMEGWEWNHLHKTLTTMTRPDPTTGTYTLAALQTTRTFVLDGAIDDSGRFTLRYAGQDPLPLAPTPSVEAGSDSLVFTDSAGSALATTRLLLEADHLHGGPDVTPVVVVATVPEGATHAVLRRGVSTVWSEALRTAVPSISAVTASSDPDGERVHVAWHGAAGQRYSVYYLTSADASPILVSMGLTGTATTIHMGFTPATTHGVFTVRASNGFTTAEATSNTVTVVARPPIAAISTPTPTAVLTDAAPVVLRGTGWDDTAGVLDGNRLQWSVDGQPAGTGTTVSAPMAKGEHDIALTVTGPTGLSARATKHVTVVAAAVAALAPAPADGTVIDLGSCPSAHAINVPTGLTRIASAHADASWVTMQTGQGTVGIGANCATLGADASFTAQVLVTGDDGAMRLLGVRVHGSGHSLPASVLVTALAIGAGVLAAAVGYLALRRRRPGTGATGS